MKQKQVRLLSFSYLSVPLVTTLLYKPAFTGAWRGCRASSSSQRCPTQGKKHGPPSHTSSGTSSCSPLSLPRSLVQQERKHLTKRSDLCWCLRWSLRQSICCVRALQIKAQLLHKANAAATCSPEPSGTSRPALAAGPRPTAASTLILGKQKYFLFLRAVSQGKVSCCTQVRLEGFLCVAV